MDRIRDLNRYQKCLLIMMAVMIVVFGVLYGIAASREGIRYKDGFLEYSEEQGNAVYSGRIQGRECRFTVSGDKTVTFRADDRTYGPYTYREDASAIPKEDSWADMMTGIEIRKGSKILFRGGVVEMDIAGSEWMLVSEDGSSNFVTITYTLSDGTIMDSEGHIIDPMEPSATDIWNLMSGPELEHRVQWMALVGGLFLCAMNLGSILFAEDLFRFGLSFRVRYPYDAEPSDWQIAQWHIGWTALTVMALALFVLGLL